MRDLQDLMELCDLVVARAEDRVPEELRAHAATTVAELRGRAARVSASLVLAIVGGTGSGKSSLLNAMAGEEVATTGRLRPHTQQPLAWVPAGRDAALEMMLDDLGISERHRHERMPGVALIDMPDVDSVVSENRAAAERVIAKVDGLLWVLDPEKYHDVPLYDDFLRPMAAYAPQTAFALNKIDLLDRQDFPRVVADVATVLMAAGYEEPRLFPVAAAPANGAEPDGIEPLAAHLSERLDAKRTSYGKLLADTAQVVRELGEASGVWRGGSIRFTGRWTVTREAALAALRPASPAPSEDALCRIEDLVAAAAAEVGGTTGDRIRSSLAHDVILKSLTSAQSAIARDDRQAARNALDQDVASPLRDLLLDRSQFAALIAQAHMAVRGLAKRQGIDLG